MSAIRNQKPFQAHRSVTRRPSVRSYAAAKLYSNPASRGRIIEWYIQELGVAGDVNVVNLDMREQREHKSDWFKQVNPFGKIPALEDGDLKLFESGAILLYLAEKYGELRTPSQRARAAQWTLFANSTMTQAVFVEQWRERSMPDLFRTLDELLSRQEYIEGDSFSVSDVAVGAYLLYIPAFFPQLDLSPYPNVLAYMKRMSERPACAATVAARATQKKTEEVAPVHTKA
ncbi:hypothetical protein VOLCADRAFT_77635 [Volvox carteri f. nagariensis]|uniref:Glutathione S-transferase n=1 Tax=Volvox carteri f. nagariensis TaxID=3068 RepID=D8UG08_VOLCA|nr:uncharacterized protein VOLCADRAFT_77635 [Volvox carteri f. nagariensis]EFJ41347.1 hypothetical protein VOLCADRAFT_77635 [Volvox carteri f. nagariensis]|eukprot:XP_002957577.1 hypothetical protein VOLCADRAFT_77635 [Volvox carteri f. nagariensis]